MTLVNNFMQPSGSNPRHESIELYKKNKKTRMKNEEMKISTRSVIAGAILAILRVICGLSALFLDNKITGKREKRKIIEQQKNYISRVCKRNQNYDGKCPFLSCFFRHFTYRWRRQNC